MVRPRKVTDEQILEVLRDPQYTSESQRARALGMGTGSTLNNRFKALREKHGIEQPATRKGGRPKKGEPKVEERMVKFQEIIAGDRLLRAGKRLIVLKVEGDTVLLKRMDGSTFELTEKQFNAAEYAKVPGGDPQGEPVTTYHIQPGTEPEIFVGTSGGPMNAPQPGDGGQGARTKPLFEEVDYTDPDWGVAEPDEITIPIKLVAGNRPYLNRISCLLDIVLPDCESGKQIVEEIISLAIKILDKGIREEVS